MGDLVLLVLDGPCAGTYDARRAQRRMVFTIDDATGMHYVLDEDGDQVGPTERAFVYEASGSVGWACGRGAGSSYRTVDFEYAGILSDGSDGHVAGEFVPAPAHEIVRIREEGRRATLAWAKGEVDRMRGRSRVNLARTVANGGPDGGATVGQQEALF